MQHFSHTGFIFRIYVHKSIVTLDFSSLFTQDKRYTEAFKIYFCMYIIVQEILSIDIFHETVKRPLQTLGETTFNVNHQSYGVFYEAFWSLAFKITDPHSS